MLNSTAEPPQPRAPLRVLLADDHPVVRSGIRGELARHADIEVVGEAASGEEVLQLAAALKPEVLILDIVMPGLKAAQVIRRLRMDGASPKILILTAYGDVENVLGMLQSGASGYLLKDEDPARIAEGVRAVAQGRSWLSPAVAQILAEGILVREALSPREREVLCLLARGLENRQIGRELGPQGAHGALPFAQYLCQTGGERAWGGHCLGGAAGVGRRVTTPS